MWDNRKNLKKTAKEVFKVFKRLKKKDWKSRANSGILKRYKTSMKNNQMKLTEVIRVRRDIVS